MTLPLTETRPAAIHASASRREATPARAMTLAMRAGSGARVLSVLVVAEVAIAYHAGGPRAKGKLDEGTRLHGTRAGRGPRGGGARRGSHRGNRGEGRHDPGRGRQP